MSRFENVTSKILTNDNHFISPKTTNTERRVGTTDRILPGINWLYLHCPISHQFQFPSLNTTLSQF